MAAELERYVPGAGTDAELGAQHLSRYHFASRFVAGRKVIDVACGTGYGSSLLRATGAASVTGIDLSADAVAHARAHYSADGVGFVCGDVSVIREAGPADCIVSFETIEHLDDPDDLLDPARGLLGASGLFIVSTPVRHGGSLSDRPANPFHVREWDEREFDRLLSAHFRERRFHYQYVYRKYPWPFSRTINRAALAAFYGRASGGFGSFPVVDRPWDVPGALVQRGYMVAVCTGGAA